MKPDQERVKNLLTDTVSLLCRNGLFFQDQLKIEGLIGITIDNNEVFLVPINNMFNNAGAESTPAAEEEAADVEEEVDESRAPSKPPSPSKVKKERSAEKFTHSTTNTPGRQSPTVKIKQEVVAEDDEDDDLIVVTKNEDCDSFQTSDQRVPPLHGTQGLPVPNLSSFDGMSGYTDSGLGEPPAKRRAGSSSRKHGSTSFSGFPQGLDSPLNQSQGSNSSWSNSNIPPELLAQMAEGQMNMDGSGAGCSTWPQQGGQPGADQMLGLPCSQLASFPIRQALREELILPVSDQNLQVSTLRFAWRHKGPQLRESWASIVHLRAEADEIVASQSGIILFVSSINGTFTRPAAGPIRGANMPDIYPAVSYWIVHDEDNLPFLDLKVMLEKRFNGIARPISRYTCVTDLESMSGALFVSVKDHNNTYVLSKVGQSLWMRSAEEAKGEITKLFIMQDVIADISRGDYASLRQINVEVIRASRGQAPGTTTQR